MRRVASVVALRPEHQERCLQLHRAVWPGVEDMIRAANITNYSIFRHDGMFFAYYEYAVSDQAADPESQRWWRLTEPCHQPLPTAEPARVWGDSAEVYRLGEP